MKCFFKNIFFIFCFFQIASGQSLAASGKQDKIQKMIKKSSLELELEKKSLLRPRHLLFIPDNLAKNKNDSPYLMLSWQSATKLLPARLAVRILQTGNVSGKNYFYAASSFARREALAYDSPFSAGSRLLALPMGVHQVSDGEKGLVLTFAQLGVWQKASLQKFKTNGPVVVEPKSVRLWIKDWVSLEKEDLLAVPASLQGSHTEISGQVVSLGLLDNDGAVVLDEKNVPRVILSSAENRAFVVDTHAACHSIVPRALILQLPKKSLVDLDVKSSKEIRGYLRLLSTQTIACDEVNAVVQMRGSILENEREIVVRGVWVQFL